MDMKLSKTFSPIVALLVNLLIAFVVYNSLVVNLCDSVYFPYTLRRTTTSVFREFRNETNLGDVFWGEFLVHWYLVLLAIVVIWGMWKLYYMPKTNVKEFTKRS